MILIFGGTTEGRLAVDVCEKCGLRFFYSTKSDLQEIEMHNGVHLKGGFSLDEMIDFCKKESIRCIINAAHPFAENLHRNIALASSQLGVSVIRVERTHVDTRDTAGITFCADYQDAISRMEDAGVKTLLALSGANTIVKLKPFWLKHRTIFRILKREESLSIASQAGLSEEDIIFFDSNLQLPTIEAEVKTIRDLVRSSSIDAMITKDSGASGGFETKVRAALDCGLKVFVVKRPDIPGSENWHKVTTRESLEETIRHLVS